MQRNWIIVAVALAAWPAGLTAQGTPRPPRPPREPRVRAFMMSDHRGRIGVVVKTDASPETDKVGAKIEGVTPGGPADKAGLKVGDIITKFNGTSLAAVKPPADSTLPLKGGDVITSIGGRKPTNPSHAMRILHSYEKGETVSIEILRKQKRMTLSWKVPAREDRMMRMHEEHEDQSGLRHLRLRRRVHLQRA